MIKALKLILKGLWILIQMFAAIMFPALIYGFLLGAYEVGFGSVWREYLFMSSWWGCFASYVLMWQSYKETTHPILYKIWAIILFCAFICVILQMATRIS